MTWRTYVQGIACEPITAPSAQDALDQLRRTVPENWRADLEVHNPDTNETLQLRNDA